MKRELMLRRIKEGKLEKYLEMHANYWPELKEEMLEGGFSDITCFVDGLNLYVFRAFDEKVMESKGKDHFKHNARWAKEMQDLLEPVCVSCKEVFHLG